MLFFLSTFETVQPVFCVKILKIASWCLRGREWVVWINPLLPLFLLLFSWKRKDVIIKLDRLGIKVIPRLWNRSPQSWKTLLLPVLPPKLSCDAQWHGASGGSVSCVPALRWVLAANPEVWCCVCEVHLGMEAAMRIYRYAFSFTVKVNWILRVKPQTFSPLI